MRFNRRRVIVAGVIVVVALIALLAFNWAPDADLVFDGWQRRTIGQNVTCQMPDTLQPVTVQGVDSMVTQFEGQNLQISFDFGWYSNRLNAEPETRDYRARTVKIGGRKAKLVRWRRDDPNKPYVAGVAFRNVSGSGKASNHLSGSALCATPAEQDLAEQIFRTIRFDDKAGSR
jgi:hypothetical protein